MICPIVICYPRWAPLAHRPCYRHSTSAVPVEWRFPISKVRQLGCCTHHSSAVSAIQCDSEVQQRGGCEGGKGKEREGKGGVDARGARCTSPPRILIPYPPPGDSIVCVCGVFLVILYKEARSKMRGLTRIISRVGRQLKTSKIRCAKDCTAS